MGVNMGPEKRIKQSIPHSTAFSSFLTLFCCCFVYVVVVVVVFLIFYSFFGSLIPCTVGAFYFLHSHKENRNVVIHATCACVILNCCLVQ